MTIVTRSWVPAASVVPQERGPDFLGPIDGAEWSEGRGYHRGFYSAFKVRAGKEVWFHFPMPTVVEQGQPLHLHSVSLLWEVADGATIGWVVVQHGGMERVPISERCQEPPSTQANFNPPELWRERYPTSARRLSVLPLRPPLKLEFGVQICVLVAAGEIDGVVRFYGAGIDLGDGRPGKDPSWA